MGSRPFDFAPGEFYHIYNRGVEKRTIYQDRADHLRFLELLYITNSSTAADIRSIKRTHNTCFEWDRQDPCVAIGAYCLMQNHFHILLTPLHDDGVSSFMNKLGTSYAMYFNHKYERSGTLCEGKFKAKHVTSDRYLKYLFAYIHLNPVKLMQADWKEVEIQNSDAAYAYAVNYPYSSLMDYQQGVRPESKILDPSMFPQYFASSADRRSELFEWLKFSEGGSTPKRVT